MDSWLVPVDCVKMSLYYKYVSDKYTKINMFNAYMRGRNMYSKPKDPTHHNRKYKKNFSNK